MYRGFPLHADDVQDPYVFRAEFPWFGIGTCRVISGRGPGAGATALHLEAGTISRSFPRQRATKA